MKNLLLFFVLTAATLVSCSNDDDATTQDPLEGKWNLVSVTSGLAGETDTFDTGVITHTYTNGVLTIVNDNTNPNTISSFLPSGTYSYDTVTISGVERLLINDKSYQIIEMELASLQLGDDVPLDGFGYSFKR